MARSACSASPEEPEDTELGEEAGEDRELDREPRRLQRRVALAQQDRSRAAHAVQDCGLRWGSRRVARRVEDDTFEALYDLLSADHPDGTVHTTTAGVGAAEAAEHQ
jgi:hypothetical protein